MSIKKPLPPTDSHCVNILKFWHKVEFFIPFDLQRQVLDDKDAEFSVRTFSGTQLKSADYRTLWTKTPTLGRKLNGFDVFFGVFDKVELTNITQRVIQDVLSLEEAFDQEQRGELEGLTCFAKIKVSAQGEPLLGEVSVSTAPWALGRIQKGGVEALHYSAFQADIGTLKETLKNFRSARASKEIPIMDRVEGVTACPFASPLNADELLTLLDIFYNWAGYRPQLQRSEAPVLVIRMKTVESKTNEATENTRKSPAKEDEPRTAEQDDEAASEEENEIDILNSFYAQDIAQAITSVQNGESCPVLEAFLTPVPDANRIDLYKPVGRQRVLERLRPDRLNAGHWLDRPSHVMSLMQQFAINSIFEQLATVGVFSVNGPPGTGKTTLLRDIFAENIVRRARALAKFESSGEAFLSDRVKVTFNGGEDCTIAPLREELAGYEMVVASSNNAAVENISRDLPKTKSLGKTEKLNERGWRDEDDKATVGYLQQVAHNVVARNSKGEYEKLSADDEPWGLISCALGKKANRTAFVERIRFDGATREKTPKGFDPERHKSLWSWRDTYKGINYVQARQAFLKSDQEVKARIRNLDCYTKLQAELQGQTIASFTASAKQSEEQAQQLLIPLQMVFESADEEWKLCNSQLESLKYEAWLIEEGRPGGWTRLFKRSAYQNYCRKLVDNREKQGEWLRRKYEVEEPRLTAQKNVARAVAKLDLAKKALTSRQEEWLEKQEELEQLSKGFPQAACPEHLEDLEQEHWQVKGLWQDEALNEKRSELFAAALQLHEAWLAEVLKKGGRFAGNIMAVSHLLSGKRLQQPEHALAIWRSLFMVVPVVSSTFASFASQFRDLGANMLGWLFIDEAGQAVPQAAVGALWRAKRAVVVGDPLQIEPVFTVPVKLIEALAKSSDLPEDRNVAPHQVSVQNLTDAANCLGAWIGAGDEKIWIGSPLRVHRRCVEPMFSIANEIAYEGKMIFFDSFDPNKRLPPSDSLNIGARAFLL